MISGGETIPGFDDIEPTIKLEDQESFVGLFDRSKEVKKIDTEKYGTRYVFTLLATDGPLRGKLVKLTGGARLYDGIAKAIGTNMAPLKLRFTQHGARGSTASTIEVKIAA